MSNFLNFNGNQGMSFKTFTGAGGPTTTTYTLDKSASTNSVLVSVGGVMQQPGVDYTVSGTTLTSTSAWTAGVQVDTYIIHKPGTAPTIQDNSIDSDHYVDGSIDLAHMSSQSVDEDNLHISNAGSNGQFLSKQSGDAGGLTWAAAGGKVVQVVTANTTAVATGTTAFPTDDTIPQNSEGVEIETLAITPTNASNLLYFWFNSAISHTANGTVVIALFQDSTANALAATEAVLTATNGGQCSFHHQMTAGTTSATTFKIRIGGQTASTLTVNGGGGSRRYGGTSTCRLTIMEVSA